MRTSFKGQGTPIPEIALPTSGSDIPPQSLLLNQGNFAPAPFIASGYTNFEVWCIGAAGGSGSSNEAVTGPYNSKARGIGGAGGGGGLHVIKGVLLDLPALVPVVIGIPGGDGDTGLPGSAGGYSSFNGATCQASGGKGGDLGVTFVPSPGNPGFYIPTYRGRGGDGGSGGQTVAGGGAAGSSTAADGDIGSWDVAVGIGKGGGGGRGGRLQITGKNFGFPPEEYTITPATAGGNGSFSYDDPGVYGPRSLPQPLPLSYTPNSWSGVAGLGGGAKLPNGQIFGSHTPGSSPEGAVFLRLTAIV